MDRKRIQSTYFRWATVTTVLVVAILVTGSVRAANEPSVPLSATAWPTIESASIDLFNTGDSNLNAAPTVEYRVQGSGTWIAGHALVRDPVSSAIWRGSIFGLVGSTTYEFRVLPNDPDGSSPTERTGTFTTKSDSSSFTPTRTLYVSTTGNDNNSGTSPAAAFRTIKRASNASLAGDRIVVAPGVYRENVSIIRSGTPSQPILYESSEWATTAGSNPAIVDGSDATYATIDLVNNWLPEGTPGLYYTDMASTKFPVAIYRATEKIYSYYNYPYDSQSSMSNFLSGTFCNSLNGCIATGISGGWFLAPVSGSNRVYLRLPDGTDPDLSQMRIYYRNSTGFQVVGASNVQIRGFQVQYWQNGILAKGNGSVQASGNVFERNLAQYNRYGIGLGGYGQFGTVVHENRVQDNLVFDSNVTVWPWLAVKLNDVESDGIDMSAGRGNIIRRNTVHDVFNGVYLGVWWDEMNQGYNRDSDVVDNVLYDIGDDGFEPEGAVMNMRIMRNTQTRKFRALGGQSGVSAAPVTVGPLWVIRNVFSDIKQTAIKFPVGTDSTTAGRVLVYHNTMYAQMGDVVSTFRLWGPIQPAGIQVTARNNVSVLSGAQVDPAVNGYLFEDTIVNHSNPPLTLDFNYNGYFSDRTCLTTCFTWRWLGTNYSTFAAFKAASGLEANGLNVDPQLRDPESGNFTLGDSSPAINAGVVLNGINANYLGPAPDLGAFEYETDAVAPAGVGDLRGN